MKSKKIIIYFVSVFFAVCSVVSAHTLWINATDYNPDFFERFGGFSRAYFGWGHRFPADGFLKYENLLTYNLINPDGSKMQLEPNKGGFLATSFKMKQEGTYWIEAVKKPGFYTIYDVNGKVHHKSAPMTGINDVILSLYFKEFSKALINTGTPDKNRLLSPLGHEMEIIPLDNPIDLKEGDTMSVQVLFKGRPARYQQVLGTYHGFSTEDDFAFATTTNKDGVAKIRILKKGPWLLKAKKKIAPSDNLKGKCLNESYCATLTFAVK